MGKDSSGLFRSLMALVWGKQGLIRTLVGRVIFQHLGRGGRILDFKGITWFLGEQRGNQSSPTEYGGNRMYGGGGGGGSGKFYYDAIKILLNLFLSSSPNRRLK